MIYHSEEARRKGTQIRCALLKTSHEIDASAKEMLAKLEELKKAAEELASEDPATKAIIITDRPGALPVAHMRTLFEQSVNSTESFRNRYDLTTLKYNGDFAGYKSAETNTFWAGFAIGLRCAERLDRAA